MADWTWLEIGLLLLFVCGFVTFTIAGIYQIRHDYDQWNDELRDAMDSLKNSPLKRVTVGTHFDRPGGKVAAVGLISIIAAVIGYFAKRYLEGSIDLSINYVTFLPISIVAIIAVFFQHYRAGGE